jgi:proline iminopeptidase
MRTLYPSIEPYRQHNLAVSARHTIYVEESGNPNGLPVVFLHGGPGSATDADHRRFFNPEKWRIILFDQRGCGKSTPFGDIEENTTWDLVKDIERIRTALGIDAWHVFGGSWGSTLALAYAETHPERVRGLILRGIFLLRAQEIQWFYQEGASFVFPDAFEDYLKPIPPNERNDLVTAYSKRLTGNDSKTLQEAASAWTLWEGKTSRLRSTPEMLARFSDAHFSYAFARIECHYFLNKGFLAYDGWLLENASKLKNIPGIIVQGRYDMVCPMKSAWELHKAWPNSKLEIVPDAGHAAGELGITDALVRATDFFAGF